MIIFLIIRGAKQSVHGFFCTYGCAPTISKALKEKSNVLLSFVFLEKERFVKLIIINVKKCFMNIQN
jgi:hypothetical protein